jgi:hypothetical protein
MKFSTKITKVLKLRSQSTLHPDKFLKVAVNWPKEAHEPSNYEKSYPANYFPLKVEHPNPDGSDSHKYSADLINPTTTRIFTLLFAGFVVYRVNDYYFKNYSQHPLSAMLGTVLDKFHSGIDAREEFYFNLIKNEQDERLLFKEEEHFKTVKAHKYYKIPRRYLPVDLAETTADQNLGSFKTDEELKAIKWKYSWNENNDIKKVLKQLE